ncbi:amylosucrase [Alginatibacterium sediminis]|uniref:Amylosucrase n=1 Tax=Alginatibacterium sediminis TaxID=2164068 RepID=A0A420EB93_9ALTE|nr:alpha-amylase family protein [Alginatibacterium sediminis]RKF17958.1 amylosucrase [Alginatibacterium sediminis]
MLTFAQGHKALHQVLNTIELPKLSKKDEAIFLKRLEQHFPKLAQNLYELYGDHYDFFLHLQQLVFTLASNFSNRKLALKKRDNERLADPTWYRSEQMLGMAVYVDLFAGDLKKLKTKIPYLQQLGVNYLHLMPLYLCPEGDSDGGYAVSDYRKVDPRLGNEKDLIALANALREAGISLVLDFVFNHTSNEHQWATAAIAGDPQMQDFYYFFENQHEVEEYNQTCREIFPSVRRGSFTYIPKVKKWVWTTFNNFQWDLNYSNPAVFTAITDEMLFLANIGCEGLRLDALAFVWKEKWTSCENLPKAHTLIECFSTCLKIVAPSVVFKSEAIVHPDEVAKYIGKEQCQLSYNPLQMALLWESLATRETKLLSASLKKSFEISQDCTWVNYIRCHDDIGWTFDDDVAQNLGIDGQDHRRFLNQFYTGRFEGSFAQGVPFQENPSTGDCRVCGSLAALSGLESAVESNNKIEMGLALKRIRLLNSINLSIGGIPLIYQGDELGMFNDHSYLEDPYKKDDSRWVNRPQITDSDIAEAQSGSGVQAQVYQDLKQMVSIRQANPVFGQARTQILDTYRSNLFAYARIANNGDKLLAICNFSEHQRRIPASICDILAAEKVVDLLTEKQINQYGDIELKGYDVLWLKTEENQLKA